MNPNDMQLKNLFVYIFYYEHVLNILLINSWIIYNGKLGIKSETLKYNTLTILEQNSSYAKQSNDDI
jgi:hypothetical protein